MSSSSSTVPSEPVSDRSHLLAGSSSSSYHAAAADEAEAGVSDSTRTARDGGETWKDVEEPEYYFGVIPADYVNGKAKPSNEMKDVTFLLISSMIGSGILSQPYCFMKAGIMLVLLLYGIIGYGIYLCSHLLVTASEKIIIERNLDPKKFEYADLSYEVLGNVGRYTTDVFITLANFFALVSYVIVIGILMSQVISTEANSDSEFDKVITRPSFDVSVIISVLVVPPCLIRNFGHLTFVSYASITLIFCSILYVIGFGPVEDTYYWKSHDFGDVKDINFWSGEGLSSVLGTIIFTLSFSTAIFPAYQSLEPRSLVAIRQVCAITIIVGGLLCTIMGLAGYLAFMDQVEDNIIYSFTTDNFWSLVTIFKLAIVFHLCFYIPMEFVVMRQCVYTLLQWRADEVSTEAHVITTLSLLFSGLGMGVALLETTEKAFVLVLAISGGICFSTLVFILPGLIAIVAFWPGTMKGWVDMPPDVQMDIGMGFFFAIAGICIMIYTFIDILFLNPPDLGQ